MQKQRLTRVRLIHRGSILVACVLVAGLTWLCLGYAYLICPQRAILPSSCALPAAGSVEVSANLPEIGNELLPMDDFQDAADVWLRCMNMWGLLCRPRALEERLLERYPLAGFYTIRMVFPESETSVWFEYVRRPTGVWVGQLWKRAEVDTL